MRLIDACALQKAIRTDYFEHFTQYHDTDQDSLFDMVCDDIEESPTVDAVEVVRCRECKYSHEDEIFGNRWCDSHLGCRKVKDDGYCYLGERKEGADND